MGIFFTLDCLGVGRSATICGFLDGINYGVKRRLLELGFVKDTIIKTDNISILKDVMLFELNGYLLSLRKNIAKYILVMESETK